MNNTEEILFKLISTGLEESSDYCIPKETDWQDVYKTAKAQGIVAICLDGLQKLMLHQKITIPYSLKMKWIASAVKQELTYTEQWEAAVSLAKLWHDEGLHTYVMKGFVLADMYPKPKMRVFCDLDCYLASEEGWCADKGNTIVEKTGTAVDRSYYKNSKFHYKGLTVENHHYLLPIKGSQKTKCLEKWLRTQMELKKPQYIGDSYLQLPSEKFNAIYVLAHAQEHFFEKGILLKHICDWAMVLKSYANKVDWNEWTQICQEYGMLSFGYAMSRLANRVCGVAVPFYCPADDEGDRRLLDDTLYRNVRVNAKHSDMLARIDLVINMFRNSWKFRLFSDTSFMMFCVRRVWGYLFDKDLA